MSLHKCTEHCYCFPIFQAMSLLAQCAFSSFCLAWIVFLSSVHTQYNQFLVLVSNLLRCSSSIENVILWHMRLGIIFDNVCTIWSIWTLPNKELFVFDSYFSTWCDETCYSYWSLEKRCMNQKNRLHLNFNHFDCWKPRHLGATPAVVIQIIHISVRIRCEDLGIWQAAF